MTAYSEEEAGEPLIVAQRVYFRVEGAVPEPMTTRDWILASIAGEAVDLAIDSEATDRLAKRFESLSREQSAAKIEECAIPSVPARQVIIAGLKESFAQVR